MATPPCLALGSIKWRQNKSPGGGGGGVQFDFLKIDKLASHFEIASYGPTSVASLLDHSIPVAGGRRTLGSQFFY